MPSRSSAAVLSFVAAVLPTGPAAAQTASAYGLPSPGDVLPNGEAILYVDECHVGDSGSWVMLVTTSLNTELVLRDGAIVLAEGDVLASGDEVEDIHDIDVTPSGVLVFSLNVDNGFFQSDKVYAAGLPWIVENSTFPDPAGSPSSYAVRGLAQVAAAFPYMVVQAQVSGGGSAIVREATLLYDFSNPLAPTTRILAEEGTPAPGGGTFEQVPTYLFIEFDVLPDGRALTKIDIDGDEAILLDGAVVARAGELSPDPALRWRSSTFFNARLSSAGHLLLDGELEDVATGAYEGERIFVDGVLGIGPGQPFGSGTTGSYYLKGQVDVQGRVHFTHRTGTLSGYARGSDMIMETGLCAIDGLTDVTVDFVGMQAISDSGRHVILKAEVGPAATERYAIVQAELGSPVTGCPVVPNSTGVIGRLEASGSNRPSAGPFP
ncbi:MAG: hypothetical protein AAGI22_26680, partial [Planctomycetota bacterium]